LLDEARSWPHRSFIIKKKLFGRAIAVFPDDIIKNKIVDAEPKEAYLPLVDIFAC